MKGKIISISGDGNLEIKRGKEYKGQYCLYQPHQDEDEMVTCGDWCPQFGEPEKVEINGGGEPHGHKFELKICQRRILKFDEFIDERSK